MNKFKSKKGFTLAELLIVVAIIAVLVAIAVPLFVAGLNRAQKAADDANVRALRSVAIAYLLGLEDTTAVDDPYDSYFTKDGTTGEIKLKKNLVVSAPLEKGNFGKMTFKVDESATEGVTKTTAQSVTTTTVTAKITQTDLDAQFSSGE